MSDSLQTKKREAYYKRMADRGLTPLWTIMADAVPHEPIPDCDPVFWSFADDIRPALLEAGEPHLGRISTAPRADLEQSSPAARHH
jgi:gentisate 1,2-dioxygenase